MNLSQEKGHDVLLVKISAMALLTVALVTLPQALGGLFTIIFSFSSYSLAGNDDSIFANVVRPYRIQMIGTAVGSFATFIVLLFLARWVSGYPSFIRKLLSNPIPRENKPLA